ncbi:VOC family protein [Demequina oxidasica]|uniref:VOC family protein n=1 Tax=Demequina oxidasica TaxID=676199 RepID=UPI00078250C1|nr:VOC family protein [Demequina oxidasica]
MADDTPHLHHSFDYVEIPTQDIGAAETFYGDAFGWRFTAYGPGYLGIVSPDGREIGGISLGGQAGSGDLLVVLYSRDLEASRDAVAAAGGIIRRDIFQFPGGRRFHFADPSGNELAVWGHEVEHLFSH